MSEYPEEFNPGSGISLGVGLNIPDADVDSLRLVEQLSGAIKVNMEASARFSGEMLQYTKELASSSAGIASQQSAGRLSEAAESLNPTGTDGEMANAARVRQMQEEGERIRDRASEPISVSRPMRNNPGPASGSRRRNSRESFANQRGREVFDEEEASEASAWQTFLNESGTGREQLWQFIQDFGPQTGGRGGSVVGSAVNQISGSVGQIRDVWGGAQGQLSRLSGVGGVAGAAARIIPMVGAGAAIAGIANSAVQGMGEQYQDMANIGIQQGGGAAEGLQFQMGVQTMALNPFISTEQARQLMTTALNAGYTGKEFDTVTKMMADNLQEFGLSASQSMSMYQKAVESGGSSIEMLNNHLSLLKTTAQDSAMSLTGLTQQFQQISGKAIDAGVSGSTAGGMGVLAGHMFNGNAMLQSEVAGQMMQGFTTDRGLTYIAMARGQGEMPQSIPSILQSEEDWAQAIDQVWAMYMPQFLQLERDNPGVGADALVSMAREMGITMTRNQAQEMLAYYEENGAIASPAMESMNEDIKEQTTVRTKGFGEGMGDWLGGNVDTMKAFAGGLGSGFVGLFDAEKGEAQASQSGRDMAVGLLRAGGYDLPALENLLAQNDLSNIQITDANGNNVKLDSFNVGNKVQDEEFLNKLASGEYKIQTRANNESSFGESQTLEEYQRSAGMNDSGGSTSGSITIDLTDDAKRLIRVDQNLTQHQSNANGGRNGATPNTEQSVPGGR